MRFVDMGATLAIARVDLEFLEMAERKLTALFANGPLPGVTGEDVVLAAIAESKVKMKLVVELLEREVRRLELVALNTRVRA